MSATSGRTRPARRSGAHHRGGVQNKRTGYLLLSPSLLLFAVFFVYPVIYCFSLSFSHWDMLFPACEVGGDNYTELLTGSELGGVLMNTLLYSVGSVIFTMAIGLFLAVALNQRGRVPAFLQACVFSSYIVSWVGISLLWVWLLDPSVGPLNQIGIALGFDSIDWLGDPDTALWALVAVTVWKTLGYDMIIFLAGLQSIPKEVYEAGALDGANGWQRFRHLTWPLLRPSTVFVGMTSLIMSFQAFDVVRVMTQGGPAGRTTIYVYYIWEQAFLYFRVGYASAAVMVFFAIILVLTVVQFRWFGRRPSMGGVR